MKVTYVGNAAKKERGIDVTYTGGSAQKTGRVKATYVGGEQSKAVYDAEAKSKEARRNAAETQQSTGREVGNISALGAGNYGADKRPNSGYNYGKGALKSVGMGLTAIARTPTTILAQGERLAAKGWNALLGDIAPMSERGLFNMADEAIANDQYYLQQKYAENTAKGGKYAAKGEELAASAVEALTSLAAAYATSGASAAMTAEKMAAQTSGKSAPAIVQTLQQVVKSRGKDPNYLTSAAQIYAHSYNDAKAEGVDEKRATLYALGNALLGSEIEISGGIQNLPNRVANQAAWRTLVDTMIDEGKEEVLQGVIDRTLQNVVYDAGNQYFGVNENAIFDPGTAAEEFAGGAIVGGLLSGGVTGLNTIANRAAYNAAKAQYNRDVRQNTAPEMDSKAAQAVDAVTRGESITGNQAAAIAKNPVAVETLEANTGVKLNTQQPISQLKRDIAALASRDTTRAQSQGTTATPVTQRRAQKPTGGFLEAGQKAYQEMSRTAEDVPTLYAGFSSVYNAGLNGIEASKAKGAYAAMLTPEQRYAAYNAGLEDAAAQVARENAEVRSVTTTASAGLADNVYSRAVIAKSKRTAATLNAMGKKLGVRIEFVDSVMDGQANGQYIRDKNLIQIAVDSNKPYLNVAAHEVTHRMQDLSPAEYRKFRQAAIEHRMREKGIDEMAEVVEWYREKAESSGVTLTQDEVMDEIAADFAGNMMENPDLFREFSQSNRTAAQKLLDSLKEFIAKVKSIFTGKARDAAAQEAYGKDFAELEAVAQKWQSAFDAAEKRVIIKTESTFTEGTEYERKGRAGKEAYGRGEGEGRTAGRGENQTVRGEFSPSSGRYGEVSADFGEKPYRAWVNGNTVTPAPGIVSYDAQETAFAFRVPSFVVSDAAWVKERGANASPAFSVHGQIFFRETAPERNRGMLAPHEIMHVMKQVNFQPYIEFLERTPDLLNFSDTVTQILLEQVADHQGATLETADPARLYDEFNATVYGHIATGQTELFTDGVGKNVFHDFPAYVKEVNSIYEQFKGRGENIKRDFQLRETQRLPDELEDLRDTYIRRYGEIPEGENATRQVRLPRRTSDKEKVSQTVRTILEANATPDEIVPTIEELALRGEYSYETYSDKQAISDAEAKIKDVGWAQALTSWTDNVRRGNVSKENTAMGWALYNNAANSGDTATALTILNNMVEHQRSAAQALQATRILKKLSPETQLYQVQRSVKNLQEEINKRYGDKKSPELKIDQELAERFLRAKDQTERDNALTDIYRDIGRQMPSRFIDKWNAWRYLAMLGNARTHIRNIVGNAGFAPVVAVKNAIATGIEAGVNKVSGGKLSRSKAFVSGKGGKTLFNAAAADFDKIQDVAMGGGKYSEFANANKAIEEGRVIFRSKVPGLKQVSKGLEKARRFNSAALETEDMWFSKPHYAYAMAQYCKANGITAEMIAGGKGIEKARKYAIKEAQKATYRDTNAFSQFVSEIGRRRGSKTGVEKIATGIIEGILPFRKTPANILMRGVEYSPLGLANGIKQALWDVRTGKKTGAEAIDSISAGLTGTGLLGLGVYLASQALLRGHGGDDDDKREFEDLQGHQTYSLELPDGTSITLDWLAPECLPLFIGVNLWEETNGGKESLTLSELLTAISNVSEPLLEMSCLQSLNAIFDVVGYAKSDGIAALPKAIASASTSYLTQALPTLLGQAERTGEGKRYTTYTNKNNKYLTPDMQYAVGKASARIPGWDYNQIPYIDAWGRTELTGKPGERAFNNFLNPAYTSKIDESPMEKELMRLYNATGEAVFPSRASKNLTVNGEAVTLGADDYVKYAQQKGQGAYNRLTALTRDSEYKKLTNEEKVRCVKDLYTLTDQIAKSKISKYEPESWVTKAIAGEKKGISATDYVIARAKTSDVESLKDKNGETIANSKGLLVMEQIYSIDGLTSDQRQYLFSAMGVGKKIIHYNKALVQQELRKMRNQ